MHTVYVLVVHTLLVGYGMREGSCNGFGLRLSAMALTITWSSLLCVFVFHVSELSVFVCVFVWRI